MSSINKTQKLAALLCLSVFHHIGRPLWKSSLWNYSSCVFVCVVLDNRIVCMFKMKYNAFHIKLSVNLCSEF